MIHSTMILFLFPFWPFGHRMSLASVPSDSCLGDYCRDRVVLPPLFLVAEPAGMPFSDCRVAGLESAEFLPRFPRSPLSRLCKEVIVFHIVPHYVACPRTAFPEFERSPFPPSSPFLLCVRLDVLRRSLPLLLVFAPITLSIRKFPDQVYRSCCALSLSCCLQCTRSD